MNHNHPQPTPLDADASLRSNSKIVSLEDLLRIRAAARDRGATLVQCHGCFDIVHPGHVRHLQHARKQGDLLLVSITADEFVGKGDGRPLFNERLRAENLAALDCVNLVYVNPEPVAEHLLDKVRPDVFIKGREYETNEDPRFARERLAVERHGGRVVFSSGDVVFSSTALVEHLSKAGTNAADGAREDPRFKRFRTLRDQHPIAGEDLRPIIDRFRNKRVVVFGEAIIDTYVTCDRPEVASESPVVSLRPIDRISFDGGAAVIALHLAKLGASASLVTALPDSPAADAFKQRMAAAGVAVHAVCARDGLGDGNGGMLEKQRFIAERQKLLKLDLVRPLAIDATMREELLGLAEGAAYAADAAILADYGLGLLTPRILTELCDQLRNQVAFIAGDVSGRRASLLAIRNADLLTPSERELREALRDFDSSLNAVAWKLMRETGAKSVFTTLADEGVVSFERIPGAAPDSDETSWATRVSGEHVPAVSNEPVDVLGCGDALLATATAALVAGASRTQAAYLGTLAAGIEVARFGNEPVTRAQLLDAIERNDRHALAARVEPQHNPQRTATPARRAG